MGEKVKIRDILGKEIWSDHDVSYDISAVKVEGKMVAMQLCRTRPYPHITPEEFFFSITTFRDDDMEVEFDLDFFHMNRPQDDDL